MAMTVSSGADDMVIVQHQAPQTGRVAQRFVPDPTGVRVSLFQATSAVQNTLQNSQTIATAGSSTQVRPSSPAVLGNYVSNRIDPINVEVYANDTSSLAESADGRYNQEDVRFSPLDKSKTLHAKLVDLIQGYSVLWRTTSSTYKDKDRKQRSWEKISVKLGVDVEYLKREWEKLKDNYRKCLQRREKMTRSGAENKKLPTCNFFTELSFLKDIVSNRKTIRNVEIVSDHSQPSTPIKEDVVAQTDSKSSGKDLSLLGCTTPHRPRNKRSSASSDLQLGIDALIVKALSSDEKQDQPPAKKSSQEDPDTLFCLSLVDSLKDLNKRKKMYVKMKIGELFYNSMEDSDDVS